MSGPPALATKIDSLVTIENRYLREVSTKEGTAGGFLESEGTMSDQKSSKPADDVVGCHRPPKASQFMANKSGNPKEHPKDSRPAGTVLQDVIRQEITVKAIATICVTDLTDELVRAFVLADNKLPEAAA